MPIIEEEELNKLHKQIEIQKNKINRATENNEELTKHRLLLAIVSGILLLLLLIGVGTYIFSPSSFMSTSKLEKEGYKMISTAEYNQIQQIADAQNAEALTNENDAYEDEYDEDENQESIDGTIIYAVQVGAFEKGGIKLYSDNLIQFTEVRKDEFYKYSLGAFETLKEAQKFRKEIVKLGFNDAFVASYKNGKRLRIQNPY